MKIERVQDLSGSYWIATGRVLGRKALAEGRTRSEAKKSYLRLAADTIRQHQPTRS